MDGWTDKWINRQKEDVNEGRTDRAERQSDIKMDEQMNRMEGETEIQTNKLTDRQTDDRGMEERYLVVIAL
jgi:hypothetical protein